MVSFAHEAVDDHGKVDNLQLSGGFSAPFSLLKGFLKDILERHL